MLMEVTVRELYEMTCSGSDLEKDQAEYVFLQGWVCSAQADGFTFRDGTYFAYARVVCPAMDLPEGSAVSVTGRYVQTPGEAYPFEIRATEVLCEGSCAPGYADKLNARHLRMRTPHWSALYRVRSALIMAVHEFFQNQGFVWLSTPYTEDDTLRTEAYAAAFRDVYTCGPHGTDSGERWRISAEIAFARLEDVTSLMEDLVRSCLVYVRENCEAERRYFDDRTPGLSGWLERMESAEYGRKEAADGLDTAADVPYFLLGSRNPASGARRNEDGSFADAELVFPGFGTVCTGREEEERLQEDDDEIHRDLKQYGGMRHGGLVLYLDDLVSLVSGTAREDVE